MDSVLQLCFYIHAEECNFRSFVREEEPGISSHVSDVKGREVVERI